MLLKINGIDMSNLVDNIHTYVDQNVILNSDTNVHV